MLLSKCRETDCSSSGDAALGSQDFGDDASRLLPSPQNPITEDVVSVDPFVPQGLVAAVRIATSDALSQIEATLATNHTELQTSLQHMQDELGEMSRAIVIHKPVRFSRNVLVSSEGESHKNGRFSGSHKIDETWNKVASNSTLDPLTPKAPHKKTLENNDKSWSVLTCIGIPKRQQDVLEKKRVQTAKVVKNAYFDYLWGAIIVMNSLLMGVDAEYNARTRHPHKAVESFFMYVQWVFATLFTLELIIRMSAVGVVKFFRGGEGIARKREVSWNMFDTAMVCISIAEGALSLKNVDEGSSEAGVGVMFRLIRMARLTRVVRVLRFCAPLRLMFFMIFECLKSLGWFLVIIFVMLYVLGICFTQAATEYLHQDTPPKFEERVERYFGDLQKSCYTLFKAMTAGQSWGEFSEVLFDMNYLIVVVWFLYISFAILCLLNVITGVFVDGALAKSQHDRDIVVEKEMGITKAIVDNLREVFEESDTDASGFISYEEFVVNVEQDERVRAYLSALGVDMRNTQDFFKLLDMDDDGEVSLDEFVESCLHLKGQASAHDLQRVLLESRKFGRRFNKFSIDVENRLDTIDSLIKTQMDSIRNLQAKSGTTASPSRTAANLGDAQNGLNLA